MQLMFSAGGVYRLEDGSSVRVHYISSTSLLMEHLDGRTMPYRIVKRVDGKLRAPFHTREDAVRSWDTWYRDDSHG